MVNHTMTLKPIDRALDAFAEQLIATNYHRESISKSFQNVLNEVDHSSSADISLVMVHHPGHSPRPLAHFISFAINHFHYRRGDITAPYSDHYRHLFDHYSEMMNELFKRGLDPNQRDQNENTLLHYQSTVFDFLGMAFLLQKGVNPNLKNGGGITALNLILSDVEKPQMTAIRDLLLSYQADIREIGIDGHTLIHLCASHNDVDSLRLFLDQGLSIDAQDELGCTPLRYAIESDAMDAMLFLMKNGASLELKDHYDFLPIDFIQNHYNPELTRAFKELQLVLNEVQVLSEASPSLTLSHGFSTLKKML